MDAKEKLRSIKRQSVIIIIIGLLVSALGYINYREADNALGTLDEIILE